MYREFTPLTIVDVEILALNNGSNPEEISVTVLTSLYILASTSNPYLQIDKQNGFDPPLKECKVDQRINSYER